MLALVFCRVQEHYRQLHEQQRVYNQQQQQLHQQHAQQDRDAAPRSLSPPPAGMSRAERIQQLRSEHQRRHKERHGQYPMDAREEQYERQLQEMERQVGMDCCKIADLFLSWLRCMCLSAWYQRVCLPLGVAEVAGSKVVRSQAATTTSAWGAIQQVGEVDGVVFGDAILHRKVFVLLASIFFFHCCVDLHDAGHQVAWARWTQPSTATTRTTRRFMTSSADMITTSNSISAIWLASTWQHSMLSVTHLTPTFMTLSDATCMIPMHGGMQSLIPAMILAMIPAMIPDTTHTHTHTPDCLRVDPLTAHRLPSVRWDMVCITAVDRPRVDWLHTMQPYHPQALIATTRTWDTTQSRQLSTLAAFTAMIPTMDRCHGGRGKSRATPTDSFPMQPRCEEVAASKFSAPFNGKFVQLWEGGCWDDTVHGQVAMRHLDQYSMQRSIGL